MKSNLRDARVLRAVREVIKRYEITEQPAAADSDAPAASRRCFSLVGGTRTWQVEVDPAWSAPPRCSCPDARRVVDANGATFCKHAIAVLLSHDDLRHQLIDLLI